MTSATTLAKRLRNLRPLIPTEKDTPTPNYAFTWFQRDVLPVLQEVFQHERLWQTATTSLRLLIDETTPESRIVKALIRFQTEAYVKVITILQKHCLGPEYRLLKPLPEVEAFAKAYCQYEMELNEYERTHPSDIDPNTFNMMPEDVEGEIVTCPRLPGNGEWQLRDVLEWLRWAIGQSVIYPIEPVEFLYPWPPIRSLPKPDVLYPYFYPYAYQHVDVICSYNQNCQDALTELLLIRHCALYKLLWNVVGHLLQVGRVPVEAWAYLSGPRLSPEVEWPHMPENRRPDQAMSLDTRNQFTNTMPWSEIPQDCDRTDELDDCLQYRLRQKEPAALSVLYRLMILLGTERQLSTVGRDQSIGLSQVPPDMKRKILAAWNACDSDPLLGSIAKGFDVAVAMLEAETDTTEAKEPTIVPEDEGFKMEADELEAESATVNVTLPAQETPTKFGPDIVSFDKTESPESVKERRLAVLKRLKLEKQIVSTDRSVSQPAEQSASKGAEHHDIKPDGPQPPDKLWWHGKPHILQNKPWELLNYMWNRAEAPEAEVFKAVWKEDFTKIVSASERIRTCLSRLKLELDKFDLSPPLPFERLVCKNGYVRKVGHTQESTSKPIAASKSKSKPKPKRRSR
jgi:hypothetical protein